MPNKITLEKYFKKAQKEGWALGQFGFYDEIMLEGIVSACAKLRSPAILGTSERTARLIGLKKIIEMVEKKRKSVGVPLFLNLDHGKSFGYIKKAIETSYDAVQFDGSELNLEDNIKQTKKIVAYARKFEVFVEGEVGVIGGEETCPEDALKFAKETKVDSLAVAIGNIHGIDPSGINPNLNLKRLKEIKEKIGSLPLVLHGGSGTAIQDIKRAIKLGVVKINVHTEIRQAQTLIKVRKVVEDKIKLFGSGNKWLK